MHSDVVCSSKPCGFRTRVIPYPRGVSGKQLSYLPGISNGTAGPSVLLLWDSNSRNLVNPQVGKSVRIKNYNCCKKIMTSIVSLCFAKSHRNFLALQMSQEVIDTIAILAFFDHLIFKNWFLDCNQFNCYVNDNSYCFLAAKCILFFKREYIGNRTC